MKRLLLAAAIALAVALPAAAQVTEVRLGVNAHDIDWTGLGSGADKERSVAINGEIVFAEPEILKWALSPQPYVGGAVNLEGETSYGGAGLLWRQTFGERKDRGVFIDVTFGLVVHDGEIEVMPSALVQSIIDGRAPASLSTAERAQFETDLADFRTLQTSTIDFGSRVLFRESVSLGYRWSEDWSAHIFAEHLSHGNILVTGRPNEGLDTLGVRVSRHF